MGIFGSRFGVTRYEADEYYKIALDFYNKHNLEQAIANITSAIELFPRRAEYYATRGLFRLEDGLPDEAETDFDQALKLHGFDVLANYGKGVIAYGREEYEIARDYFTRTWAASQQRPETLYYLAMTEHRLKNNRKALEWMQQVVAIYAPLIENDKEARKRHKNAERWIVEFAKLVQQEREQT
jgi:tetratricopeptide (TPR) repeat protein